MKNKIILPLIFIFILFLDQFTKLFVVKYISPYGHIKVLEFLNISHVENSGVAFGFLSRFSNFPLQLSLIIIYIIAIILLTYFLYKDYHRKLSKYGYILIITGAIGNLIDRIRIGRVIDFIDFHIKGWHYPSFNVADSAITIGIIIILLDYIIFKEGKNEST
jgi:signal peptidase II